MVKAQHEMNGAIITNSPKQEEIEEDSGEKFSKTEPVLDFVKSEQFISSHIQ